MPFYVYKYATSITAAFVFYDLIKKEGSQRYLSFLKAGGSQPPLKILKQFNIDYQDPQVYNVLFANLKRLIAMLEQLLNK